MKARAVYVIALLSIGVLPAQSEPPAIESTLTLIDTLPTKAQLQVFAADPVPKLTELALAVSTDFGVRLRAIRSLPQFCSATAPTCKEDSDAQMHPIRVTIRDVLWSGGRWSGDPQRDCSVQARAPCEPMSFRPSLFAKHLINTLKRPATRVG